MTAPLLRTKLYIPRVRPEFVPRPRLTERLNEAPHRKLTLVSAPAGFGKSTLLSQWVAISTIPVAWLRLDEKDNDLTVFWSYVIAALQTIHRDSGPVAPPALQSLQWPSVEALVAGLINEIPQEPFVLILDDFHVITDPSINAALVSMLDNLPSQMHLILSSRADPPWPLARLRAQGEMIELRATDLRFTSAEAVSFLNQVMGLDLSPEDVATLERRTEGWIAGLQMAALSMRGREDLSRFIETFSGSHRFVLDYLVEEVLSQQSAAIQDFLLKTSILDRLTGALCESVAGDQDGQAVLTQLEQANLFLVPLDDERRWYRYHRLFADLLRSRLRQKEPEQVPVLHRRASEWYESRGQLVEAVEHALAAEDVERIERLVSGNALALIYHGELGTMIRWLDALPSDLMRSRPWLSVAYAWALTYAGQFDDVEPLLRDAETALTGSGVLGIAEGQQVAGHIAAIRTYVAGLQGEWSRAGALAREALERLPETDLPVRGLSACALGCVLRSGGDLEAAAQAFSVALVASRAAGDSYLGLTVDVLWEQAMLQLTQGQLRNVMQACEEALQLADRYAWLSGRQVPVTGYTLSLMSRVLYEWNDLESALRHAQEGLELCTQWGQADALAQGSIHLASVLHAIGDADGALDAIQDARQAARGLSPWYAVTAGASEARIQLAQGDMPAAIRWMEESGLRLNDAPDIEYQASYLVVARILLAQGRPNQALDLLARLLETVEAAGAMGAAIGALVLQALALQAQGEDDQALAQLERALSLAQPEGYVRIFIKEGAPMGDLLRQAIARGIRLDYAGRLLAAMTDEPPLRVTSVLVDPLSERELEVLRLLTTHLSSTEIARELVISVNTVRSHVKSIYGKLEAHSRREAVARARDLGLL
ncbi:MAG: LuxR C-terminal-related transcriptional regulator [Anaerolineae bacterium]|jgi:LuxR family maltose regulon positive regulatory protein